MLTNTKITRSKPRNKAYTLGAGDGLHLEIHPNRKKYWRYRFTFNGKRHLMSLGVYPSVTLANAKIKRDEYKEMIANGVNPSLMKKQEKAKIIITFGDLIKEWHDYRKPDLAKSTADKIMRNLNNHLLPWLAPTPIEELTPQMLLQCLRKVEVQGKYETANRLKQWTGQAFRYGVHNAYCKRDITQDLRGALKTKPNKHHATLVKPMEISRLLQDIDNYSGSFVVKTAMQFSPLVFVRPLELSRAKWQDIDFNSKEWTIKADDMKKVQREMSAHVVPLSSQAIAVLKEIEPLTGGGEYVFYGHRDKKKSMSSESINVALRKMGYKNKITSHGFKAMASTLLNENGFRRDVIEKQLAHGERNSVRAAYNHAQYLPERKDMMQWWGDYLDHLKNQDNILPFKKVKKA